MSNDINNAIKRLKECVENSGLSYAELEKRTHIAKSSIQRYVNGITKKIPIDSIIAISKAIDVSPSYIMGWDDQISKEKPTIKECRLFDNCHGSESFSVVRMFLRLDNIDKTKMVERIQTLLEAEKYSKKISKEETTETDSNFHPLTDEEIEAEVADYRRELIEEKRAREKSSALPDLKES